MRVGLLKVDFYIPESGSLKSKRKILKSVKDKIRNRFNVSIAEIENHDKWQLATLGMACLGQDKPSINSLLDRILNFFKEIHEIELGNYEIELW